MTHSIIAPSSAGIWGKPGGCTAWPMMAAAYPETERSPESIEGDRQHELGVELVNLGRRGQPFEVDEPVYRYAEDIVDQMRKWGIFGGEDFGLEQRVEMPEVHELSYGTIDGFLYNRKLNKLILWDYKNGHRRVDAFENWQIINYYPGVCRKLGITGQDELTLTVEFRIVRPNVYRAGGPIDRWVVPATDLRPYVKDLHHNAHEALGPNAKLRAGDHCRDCPARHACPAFKEYGLGLYDVVMEPLPEEIPPHALGVELMLVRKALKALTALEAGLAGQAESLFRQGEVVPGLKSETTYGREKWALPAIDVIKTGELIGANLREDAAVNPKRAKEMGVDEALVDSMTTKPKTGTRIVPTHPNDVKKVFL